MVARHRHRRQAVAGAVPWTALAIIIAGACIGLGLYFGLRPSAAAPPPKDDTAARAKAVAEAVAFIESQRAEFVRTCWTPSVEKAAEPARIRLVFNLTFDEHGKEIGRGISEDRAAHRGDVAQCIRALNRPAEISPPGVTVPVEVTINLPN